jgi:hypothetical protein
MSDRPATVPHMGKKALFDRAGMADLLARQSGVITRSQAQACAMSDEALRHRLRPGGPWQVLLSDVYLTTTGGPARPQRLTLAVADKNRLAWFGFGYLEHIAARAGCEILVANQQSLSPERELTEDLLAIVHTFSCRLYGLRTYRKTLQQALSADVPR